MSTAPAADLTELVYELLDAHQDTVELAVELPQAAWHAHLDYLRALQRKGHELLASTTALDREQRLR